MFARVTRYERFDQDEAVRYAREQFIPAAQRSGGFEGMYVLVDPDGSGNALALTLWESKEAMHASEEMGASSREEVVRIAGGSVVDVERATKWPFPQNGPRSRVHLPVSGGGSEHFLGSNKGKRANNLLPQRRAPSLSTQNG